MDPDLTAIEKGLQQTSAEPGHDVGCEDDPRAIRYWLALNRVALRRHSKGRGRKPGGPVSDADREALRLIAAAGGRASWRHRLKTEDS